MAFHLYDIPQLDTILIRAAEGSFWSSILNAAPISLLFIVQFSVIMFAALCTAVCLWRIRVRQVKYGAKTGFWCWIFITAICAVYLLLAVALILPGGVLS